MLLEDLDAAQILKTEHTQRRTPSSFPYENNMARKLNSEHNHRRSTIESGSEEPAVSHEPTSLPHSRNRHHTVPLENDEEHNTTHHTSGGEESLNIIGSGVKTLVQAVQGLRRLGVEDLVLPLPKIVVVGDQSTGKSSLIEGMSEIKVPRSTGTCTRCPLEINLTTSDVDEWSCKVSLHKKYFYTGPSGFSRHSAKAQGASRSRPLGPWMQQNSELLPFVTLDSVSQIQDTLRLAQLATLNPGRPHQAFLPGSPDAPDSYEVKFSPNVIRLDITGRNLPNLSFYDLPGVINVSDVHEEAYLVDLVKNLVKEYITQEDCINLLAVPMTHDPANSSAARLIREAKAGSRTLGCLTKPDRLQEEESLDQWTKILRGEHFRLGYGYHIIKNNADPVIDHATARTEEDYFFQTQEPWPSTFTSFSKDFGTANLQSRLSGLLTTQIQKSLPQISAKVKQKAIAIDAELHELPEPESGNLGVLVVEELLMFDRLLQEHIDGGSEECIFQTKFHELANNFWMDLSKSKPGASLPDHDRTPSHGQQNGRETNTREPTGTPTPTPTRPSVHRHTINIESDEEQDRAEMAQNGVRSGPQSSGRKRPHPIGHDEQLRNVRPRRDGSDGPSGTIMAKKFAIGEVTGILQNTYIGLPGQVHPKAIEKMIRMSMEHWPEPVNQFLRQTKSLCENTIASAVYTTFGHRQATEYFSKISRHCGKFIKDAFDEQVKMSHRILAWETGKPKTMNKHVLFLARKDAVDSISKQRRRQLAGRIVDEQEERRNLNRSQEIRLTAEAREEKINKIQEKDLPMEKYRCELQAIADTRAYYECAFSRFVDTMCSSIHSDLFANIRQGLFESLKTEIGVRDEKATERLAVLLSLNPSDEQRRIQLKQEKETIQKALEQLDRLQNPEDRS